MKPPRIKAALRNSLETLERRDVPATWGIAWPDPQHLTASFVPDGTNIEGSSSVMYQKLDAQLGAGKWENTIVSAIEAWASQAKVNIGVVGDNGASMGVAGMAQGDPRFGDIRISAAPLSASVLAITSPYDPSTGTNSGDMIINSNANFAPGTANSYDLYTVALHEAGHIFGFADNSTDPKNFMYNGYTGPVTGLASGAVPALQAVYGAPVAGASEQKAGALNFAAATALNPPSTVAGVAQPSIGGLTSSVGLAGDTALFKYTTTSGADYGTGVDFVVRNAGISLFTPTLTVYSASGAVLGTASASGPLAGGVGVHLGNIANVSSGSPGVNYYLAVSGTGGVFSQGAFQVVGTPSNIHVSTSSVKSSLAVPMPQTSGVGGNPLMSVNANINAKTQADLYSFVAPSTASKSFMIRLATAGTGLTTPSFQLFNSSGSVISQAVASAATGETDLTVSGYTPGATYYVQVVTGGQTLGAGFGSYRMMVDFSGKSTTGLSITSPNVPFLVGGTAASTATPISPIASTAPATASSSTAYRALSSLAGSSPAVFQVTTPTTSSGMTIYASVMGLDNSLFNPQVTVTTAAGASVNGVVICAEGGMMEVEIPNASSGTTYLISVTGGQPGASVTTGNFYLDVTCCSAAAATSKLAGGGLSQASSTITTSLTIANDQVYRFILNAGTGPVGSGLVMNVYDSTGKVVATLSTSVNQTASLTTRLAQGTYTVKVVPTYAGLIGNIQCNLTGMYFTDPIKVYSSTSSGTSTPKV